MSADWTTEMISHFIGLFEISEERARLRDDYDRFKAEQARDDNFSVISSMKVKFKAPYTLKKIAPVDNFKEPMAQPFQAAPYYIHVNSFGDAPVWPFFATTFPDGVTPLGYTVAIDITQTQPAYNLTLDPAGSVATATFQANSLIDNDLIVGDGTIDFLDPELFLTDLYTLAHLAGKLQSFDIGTLPTSDNSATDIAEGWKAIVEAAQEDGALPNAPAAAAVSVQFGASVSGNYVNGELVDEVPVLADLLPEKLSVADNEVIEAGTDGIAIHGEGLNGVETDAPSLIAAEDTPKVSPYEVPDGHNVLTGGNQLLNETIISVNWLDAPAMAVMGDVYAINAISQINVVSDLDTGLGATDDAATQALNISQVTHISNPFAPQAGELPTHWVVATLQADVIASNWVEQFNFVTDTDRAEVTFTGQDTFLQLGDNSIVNASKFLEIGFGYDLIVIGGSIININAIAQTNILLDNDAVTSSGGIPGVTHTSGNVMANFAAIHNSGIDQFSMLSEDFAASLAGIQDGYGAIGDGFEGLDAFSGVGLLRVLHIEGDLLQMNLVKQTNILGDADQVHVALADFLGAHDSVTVNTGDNTLINTASVGTYGIDSDVYVGGQVYSDAILVQAELIDTDADPLGVNLTSGDLASEAVAFLADDMISPSEFDHGIDPTIVPTTGESTTSAPDSLQVMLA
ncbi:hypothetical protein [Aliiroseovarius lamellibrachiae]|uniref:hypothetical protein n=1 Tax=Aliiroseovarius lamellibrachiae TaxID=1924933 RepID=UPI001BDFCC06|nr:hypothetical protein [Aliiroseovarius lamellibrachiae]MBT2131642.1 hypothetical protein [Aliiroseovarius lamellibrachiae]